MKTEKKYLYVLIGLLAVYVFFELQKPEETDWRQTFHFRDKIPFGTQVLHELLPDLFDGQEAEHDFNTLYAGINDLGYEANYFILGEGFGFSELDVKALLNYVNEGHKVILAAYGFGGGLSDTLELSMDIEMSLIGSDVERFQQALSGELNEAVSLEIPGQPKKEYQFPDVVVPSSVDYYADSIWQPLAFNEEREAVLLRMKNSPGELYITTIPLAFTNYFILDEATSGFSAAVLSLLPEDEPLIHNEYYHLGRQESSSPIRFFLKHEALRWAVFLLMGITFIFILFEAKRRQRIIPIIRPLQNTTLEFVGVLGRLYYRQSSHTKLAQKRFLYWKDYVRNHYNLRTDNMNEEFIKELVRKSGCRLSVVRFLVEKAEKIAEGASVNEGDSMLLEKWFNEFYKIK